MKAIVKNIKELAEVAQKAGPYLILEILLPGGTLFALFLFLYRNRSRKAEPGVASRPTGILERALDEMRGAVLLAQPSDIAALANSDAANDADGLGPLAMVPRRCA